MEKEERWVFVVGQLGLISWMHTRTYVYACIHIGKARRKEKKRK